MENIFFIVTSHFTFRTSYGWSCRDTGLKIWPIFTCTDTLLSPRRERLSTVTFSRTAARKLGAWEPAAGRHSHAIFDGELDPLALMDGGREKEKERDSVTGRRVSEAFHNVGYEDAHNHNHAGVKQATQVPHRHRAVDREWSNVIWRRQPRLKPWSRLFFAAAFKVEAERRRRFRVWSRKTWQTCRPPSRPRCRAHSLLAREPAVEAIAYAFTNSFSDEKKRKSNRPNTTIWSLCANFGKLPFSKAAIVLLNMVNKREM